MNFFERQDNARRQTRWLLAAFALSVLTVVVALDIVVLWALGGQRPMRSLQHSPGFAVGVALLVTSVILGASWRKSLAFREGGPAVARALGGVPVTRANPEFAKQQLLNIVEEMAIAAGMPPPKVFVIPDEPGINAFAAGHTLDDAAIAVTAGALAALTREELQAVIGHEFSHVRNGDMALNIRLIAWVYGLYVVTVIARRIMRNDAGKRRTLRVWLGGIAVLCVGSAGLLAGRLLQAAVSRRREQLADASSVQFTRNPGALKVALLKIAGHDRGSTITAPAALEVAHMFFADAETGGWSSFKASLFATHPPMAERIRALDPGFLPSSLPRLAREAMQSIPAPVAATPPAVPAPVAVAASPALAAVRTAVAADLQTPARRDSATAAPVARPMKVCPAPAAPEAPVSADARAAALRLIQSAAASDPSAEALAFAGALTHEPAARRAQIAAIAKVLGPATASAVTAACQAIDAAPPHGRLPALIAALKPLAARDATQRRKLLTALTAIDQRNPSPTLLQCCFMSLAKAQLSIDPAPPAQKPLKDLLPDVATLLAVGARLGNGAPARQKRAFAAGMTSLGSMTAAPEYPAPDQWREALGAALTAMRQLHPGARRLVRDALALTVGDDQQLTAEKAELLRSTCALLDVAMPAIETTTAVLVAQPSAEGAAGSAG